MEKKSFKSRREAGKNPATGRSAGRGERPTGRVAGTGKGPNEGGVDLRSLDRLAEAGLLSSEGKRLKASMGGGAPEATKRPERREASGGGLRVRRESTGAGSRVRREGDAERPRLRRGAAPTFGMAGRPAAPQEPERLHKVMAKAGLASRRHSEELIQAGRVSVNGEVVTQLGTKVTPGKDIVEIDGRAMGKAEDLIYIILNKPKGYVTTLFDPQGRKKVTDLLLGEVGHRVYPVGRLDYGTEGLLLLTNDGELANALMHPSQLITKTYIAKVRGVPNAAKVTMLEKGIELEDGMTAPAEVKLVEAHGPNAATLSIKIHEGRNRQVRRMFEAVGHEVISLRRSTMGPLHIKTLKVGEWRYLTPEELMNLRSAVGDRTAARSAYMAAMAAPRAKGRPATAEGPETEGVEATPRLRPVLGGTRPVTEGTKPVLGRPTQVAPYTRSQEYGTTPFRRPSREGGAARFDREGAKPYARSNREGAPARFDREGAPARFDREGGAKPFGRPTRADGPGPSASFDRESGAKPLGQPTPADGAKPFGQPTRVDGPRPSARFDRAGGAKSFDRPARADGAKSFDRPARADGAKPIGLPTRAEGGAKPYARNDRDGGAKPYARPNREGGAKPYARAGRDGDAKPYARPKRNFTPRPDEVGGTGPIKPQRPRS